VEGKVSNTFYQSEVFKQIVDAIQEKYGPIESFHVSGEIACPDTFHCGGEEYRLHYLDGVIPVYVPYEEEEEVND
jgi:hypothetical protein